MRARLLLVIDEMEVGGTQRQMVHLVRGLNPSRFEVEILFFRQPSFLVDELKSMGTVVHEIPKRGAIDLAFLTSLHRLISNGRFDLVHAFSFTSELWSAVVLAMLFARRRPELISSVRGTYEWYSTTQWRLKRWVSKRSAFVIANSKMGAQFAKARMRLPDDAISIVYNGLPVVSEVASTSSSALRKTLGLKPGAFFLLFVGRLVEHKNIETLLRAMGSLQASSSANSASATKTTQLVIAGDGPDRHALHRLSRSLGLEHQERRAPVVQWLGERRDVAQLLAACDALVLPSWREGLSNVILEAMQAGKPVIASTAGGNVESVVVDKTGLMFDPADPEELAALILKLAADDALAVELGQAGRQRANELFTLENMVRQTEDHYLEALRRAGKAVESAKTTDQATSA